MAKPDDELIPFTMRMPRSILEALDAWIADINRGRKVGKVTRSEVIRVLLERGALQRLPLEDDGGDHG